MHRGSSGLHHGRHIRARVRGKHVDRSKGRDDRQNSGVSPQLGDWARSDCSEWYLGTHVKAEVR